MAVLAAFKIESGHVLIGIPLLVLPIAAIAFARSGRAWQEIGKGRLAIEQELPRPSATQPPVQVDQTVVRTEARQMLEARSYRQSRGGGAPLDVEAEVSRLLHSAAPAPEIDDELRAEVRRLVVVANERRMRHGEEPLDVEAETERQLADFIGSD
jgi:hypothetical protein